MIIYTASTRLLNTCPPVYSCGTDNSYWSDDVLPTEVGVLATITAYMSKALDYSCNFEQATWSRVGFQTMGETGKYKV